MMKMIAPFAASVLLVVSAAAPSVADPLNAQPKCGDARSMTIECQYQADARGAGGPLDADLGGVGVGVGVAVAAAVAITIGVVASNSGKTTAASTQ